jgi:hypothetical protein
MGLAVAVASNLPINKQAWPEERSACLHRQNSLVFFIACFQSEYKRFPRNLDEIARVVDKTVHFEKLLFCPMTDRPYKYLVSSDGTRFQIKCEAKQHPYYSSKTGPHYVK